MKWTCKTVGILAAVMLSGCTQGVGKSPPPEPVTTLAGGLKIGRTTPDQIAAEQEKRNGFQQQCMKKAGFTYIPFTPKFDTENDDLPDSTEEAVARWGFDISTNLEAKYSGKGYGQAKLVEEDPNIAITQGFSRQEQAAYQQAMVECSERATKELGPPLGVTIDSGGNTARREKEIQLEVEKDGRVIKATGAWQSCMSEQGFGAMGPDQLRTSIQEKATPFIEKYEAAVSTDRDEYLKSGADYWPGSDLRVADVLSPEELVELTNLQRYEIGAAAADLACNKELNEVIGEVSKEKHAEPEVK